MKPIAVFDTIALLSLSLFSLFIISIFIAPPRIDGVYYMFVEQSSLSRPSMVLLDTKDLRLGLSMDADGTFIRGSPPIILINNQSTLVNWSLRHENCHARQMMENRTSNELECYARMMFPWE